MADNYKTHYFKDRKSWRRWLIENHLKVDGIWFVYYKKHTGIASTSYMESVEEALCFGWIDSTKKRLDDERYVHKFTPRKNRSNWSDLNKKIVKKLILQGKMTEAGMKKINEAKKNGEWQKKDPDLASFEFSEKIRSMLQANIKAYNFFITLSPKQQAQYTAWIMSGKKPETQIKRINKLIAELEKERKLGFM